MMSEISCPACEQGKIAVDPQALLAGASFSCASCGAAVAVAPSGMEPLKKGVDEFTKMQQELAKLSPSEPTPGA